MPPSLPVGARSGGQRRRPQRGIWRCSLSLSLLLSLFLWHLLSLSLSLSVPVLFNRWRRRRVVVAEVEAGWLLVAAQAETGWLLVAAEAAWWGWRRWEDLDERIFFIL
jgi:hypothetical protein